MRKKIPKIEKPKDIGHFIVQNFDFCTCPSHNALKRNAGGKKGTLLCCKYIFHQIKGYLAEIQPKNRQNVQKTQFLQKVPVVNIQHFKCFPSGYEYSSFLAPLWGPQSSVRVQCLEQGEQVSVQACPGTQVVWISFHICQERSLQPITSPFSPVHHHLDRFQPHVQGATGSRVTLHP